jgi:hypothetical protein
VSPDVTAETWLRLALVPLAVWAASIAARRWGHAASGYLGGLPLIGGPITLFLALDQGVGFASTSALFTLAAIAAQCAHLLALSHAAARLGWAGSLLAGWTAFALVAVAVAALPLTAPAAATLALAGLAAAWKWLPPIRGHSAPPAVPALELRLRVAAAFVLAAGILLAAPILGPVASGILLSVPITGSIMPPFTLALYGREALARLARGFVVGLSGFTAFFLTVAAGLPAWGVGPGFTAAVLAALAAVAMAGRLVRARR